MKNGDGVSVTGLLSHLAFVQHTASQIAATRRKKLTFSAFFGSQPRAVTAGYLQFLCDCAVSSVEVASPSMAVILRLLLRKIVRPCRPAQEDELSIAELALFVVLQTSLAVSRCSRALLPALSMSSPLACLIEELLRRDDCNRISSLSRWCAEVNPVVASSIVSSVGAVHIDDTSFISDSSASDEDTLRVLVGECSFAQTYAASVDSAWGGKHSWKREVDPQYITPSVVFPFTAAGHHQKPDPALLSLCLPFRRSVESEKSFRNGVVLIAMHRAILGLPDPHLVIAVDRTPHPVVRLDGDVRLARAEHSIIRWCCEKGTLFSRLDYVVRLALSSWQWGPLGRYGCAAISALNEQLFSLRQGVATMSELPGH
jgi:hypothetical protein